MASKRDFALFYVKAHVFMFCAGLVWGLSLLVVAQCGPVFGGVVVR